ncbi:MAG: hypothetical protein ACFE9Z_04970 [Promethearchaeota archaeon]
MTKLEYEFNEFEGEPFTKKKIVADLVEDKRYLKIWKTIPSFKDINNTRSYVKAFSVVLVTLSIMILNYLMFQELQYAIGIGILCLIVFLIVFHDEFFSFSIVSKFKLRPIQPINPFEDVVFWYEKDHPSHLYLSNRKDLINTGIHIYQLTVIPENVEPAVKSFIIALSSMEIRLPYTYQIINRPTIPLFQYLDRETGLGSNKSRVTNVFFMVSYSTKGILTNSTLDNLRFKLTKHSNNLKTNFVSNFHHVQIKLLSGESLINAIRTFFIRHEGYKQTKKDKRDLLKGNHYLITLGRFGLMSILLIFYDIALFIFSIQFLYIIAFNALFTIAIIMIWWRSVFFQYTRNRLLRDDQILIRNPFNDVSFYYMRQYPYSLFIHIAEKLLVGVKMINLRYLPCEPSCNLRKFIESLYTKKISFSYSLRNKPLHPFDVEKHGLKNLNERTRKYMYSKEETLLENEGDWEKWLSHRFGMWYSTLVMSVIEYRYIDAITSSNLQELEDDLLIKLEQLKGAFYTNIKGSGVVDLRSQLLISGFIFNVLKTNRFRLNGSHLNYMMLQGAYLIPLTMIASILRRGIPVKLAAEFNTPLYLENFITIGHTYNTEVLEEDVPIGFTKEQLQNLLILNGYTHDRNAICMQIVAELIKLKMPSIIFDFHGTWSKLLQYYKGSQYEQEILYFKYKNAFIIDPIKSDIPYDKENIDYLEYMLDAFALALKKDQRTVEMFRTILQKHSDMDLQAIRMSLQHQPDWEKSPISDTLLAIFSDFTQDDLTFFQQDSIVPYSFVQNKKTIIIDLSTIRELNKKSFLGFIILAKIIHFIANNENFESKFIIMPYADIFFDSYHLDLKRNYDKTDLFLRPLLEKGFGLIFSANQVHYLHANFLGYFNNYIALKTIDNRDIAMLRNLMNLQEVEGMGVFSRNRNQTYQIQYLKNLDRDTVIIHRDDIDQPFPAVISRDAIQKQPLLTYTDIVKFMKIQGYDLKGNEKKILERAKKTIFEIDLGHYYIYVKEIITFLDELKTIDQIGNLYKHKLEKHLKEILYPSISRKTNNKIQIKKTRDEILNLLIRQGYLVENHPQRASGSEALRTSYSVGERYEEALQDYYETKGNAQKDIRVPTPESVSDSDSALKDIFQSQERRYIIPKHNIKKAFLRELSNFHMDLFTAYEYINRKDYDTALKIEHGLIKKYLVNVYRHYYNVNSALFVDINKFLAVLAETKNFPFTKQEIISYIDRYQVIKGEEEDIESLTKEIYELTHDFFMKIQQFVNQEE